MKLPDGYQSIIGENGVYLSGGEQQRLAIARVILRNTPIVVLDEATAYADAENEEKIKKAFAELAKDKTVLIIAHRMRTVDGADKIVVLKDGGVAEAGSPEELKGKKGLYSSMISKQMSSMKWRFA